MIKFESYYVQKYEIVNLIPLNNQYNYNKSYMAYFIFLIYIILQLFIIAHNSAF